MVVMRLPSAADTGVMQERVGYPSIWIVQAPHRPCPHANFVPVMASTSRSVHSSGMSSGTSTSRDFPFTFSLGTFFSFRVLDYLAVSRPCAHLARFISGLQARKPLAARSRPPDFDTITIMTFREQ